MKILKRCSFLLYSGKHLMPSNLSAGQTARQSGQGSFFA